MKKNYTVLLSIMMCFNNAFTSVHAEEENTEPAETETAETIQQDDPDRTEEIREENNPGQEETSAEIPESDTAEDTAEDETEEEAPQEITNAEEETDQAAETEEESESVVFADDSSASDTGWDYSTFVLSYGESKHYIDLNSATGAGGSELIGNILLKLNLSGTASSVYSSNTEYVQADPLDNTYLVKMKKKIPAGMSVTLTAVTDSQTYNIDITSRDELIWVGYSRDISGPQVIVLEDDYTAGNVINNPSITVNANSTDEIIIDGKGHSVYYPTGFLSVKKGKVVLKNITLRSGYVSMSGGNLTIEDAVINASSYSAIGVSGGTLTLSGSTDVRCYSTKSTEGDGIRHSGSQSSYVILKDNAKIHDCTGNGINVTSYGSLRIEDNATICDNKQYGITGKAYDFVISGGTITRNAGGIYIENQPPKLSGNATVTGNIISSKETNIYLPSRSNTVTINEGWTGEAGVTLGTMLSKGEKRAVTQENASNTGILTSDNSDYCIVYDSEATRHFIKMNPYTISWLNEDGSLIDTTLVDYGDMPVHEDPVKEGTAQYSYTFAGWTPELTAATGNAEYTASFTETLNSYDVTWKNWDGSVLKTDSIAYGTIPEYTGEPPVRPDDEVYEYEFSGWTPELTEVTGEAEYTAVYTAEIKLIPVTGVTLNKTKLRLLSGSQETLIAEVTPADASNPGVTWASDNSEIAEVDQNGTVTGISSGTTVIKVITEDNSFSAECEVTVIPPDGLYVEGLNTNYPYTGSALKPDVKVYDGDKLLKAGTDYTITYKNNTKAAAADSAKAPTITIKGKGSYTATKTLHFNIDPADINEATVAEVTLAQTAKPKTLTVSPKVTWNGKTLKAGTDFTVDYFDWDRKSTDQSERTVTLVGKGNFTGTKEIKVYVASSEQTSVSKLKITPAKVAYTDGMTQETVLGQIAVKDGKKTVDKENYEISDIENCDHAGTCTFVLTGKGDKYYGKRTVSVTITGKSLSKVKASGKAVYNGEKQTLAANNIILMDGKNPLTEGTDYEIVEYKNNTNAGKASVTIQGMNAYSGKKTVTFTISPDVTEREVTITDTDPIFEKGGVKPKVTVEGLTEGTDFKVTYKNNTKVADINAKKAPTATVTFLGNYKGTPSKSVKFNITQKDISTVDILASQPVYANKKSNYKAKITLYDANGTVLKAGTDYTIKYFDEEEKEIASSANLPEDKQIKAIATGKGNYTGTTEVTYSFITKPQDISKATFKITPQEYTGYEIELDEEDITSAVLKASKSDIRNLEYGQDYEVYRCINNVKNGTAKVVFRGINGYGGTKTVSFKINKKNVPNHWFEQFIGLFSFGS